MDTVAKLPAPTQDQWEWQYEGACREADPELFFHPRVNAEPQGAAGQKPPRSSVPAVPSLDMCRERSLYGS